MKKIITLTLVLIALCGIATAELYPETARIIALDYQQDLVTVETFNGELFTFEGCEDYAIGDCVSLIMEDNNTDSVQDDEIVKAQYSAWMLTWWEAGE